MSKVSIFWFRRDLRLEDNAGLYHALRGDHPVLPLFIFDSEILDKLEDRDDARVTFIHDTLTAMRKQLGEQNIPFCIRYGNPAEVWAQLLDEYSVAAIYTNRDYEPYAKERDAQVAEFAADHNVEFKSFKDHVIFESDEVQKKTGGTYTVFTPYSKMWRSKLDAKLDQQDSETLSYYFKSYPVQKYSSNFIQGKQLPIPSLNEMNFTRSKIEIPKNEVDKNVVKNYSDNRNFPAINGTSRLGIHLRFGTMSIRQLAQQTRDLNFTFLNELIWRDFYSQILDVFPHVDGNAFREKYEAIPWINNEEHFAAWCAGKTGYPLVDAGMRELNTTGHMHNRVRMVVASFLTKHLLIDWRWGEAYFARKLLDFDLASNNGGWQWAAGCGTDAAPYFRVFNPSSQLDKFDKQKVYTKKWVPEFGTDEYPEPIVEHKSARQRAINTYKTALQQFESKNT